MPPLNTWHVGVVSNNLLTRKLVVSRIEAVIVKVLPRMCRTECGRCFTCFLCLGCSGRWEWSLSSIWKLGNGTVLVGELHFECKLTYGESVTWNCLLYSEVWCSWYALEFSLELTIDTLSLRGIFRDEGSKRLMSWELRNLRNYITSGLFTLTSVPLPNKQIRPWVEEQVVTILQK